PASLRTVDTNSAIKGSSSTIRIRVIAACLVIRLGPAFTQNIIVSGCLHRPLHGGNDHSWWHWFLQNCDRPGHYGSRVCLSVSSRSHQDDWYLQELAQQTGSFDTVSLAS